MTINMVINRGRLYTVYIAIKSFLLGCQMANSLLDTLLLAEM